MDDALAQFEAALADRYRVERELGRGGMATVYLAEDRRHSRKVAIKVLRPELGAILGSERFLNEIKVTASLNHPHILPLHDSGEAAGFLYYVMPFVEGESLRQRLARERQIPVDEAVTIAREVADALGVSGATISRLGARHELRAARIGGRRLFDQGELSGLLADTKTAALAST